MRTEPIWGGRQMGLRILGLDLARPEMLDFAELSRLVHRHKVVSFAGQDQLSQDEYIAFARGLGSLVPFRFKNYSTTRRPEIMILDNQAHKSGLGGRRVGNMWHSDSSYQERPLDLTLLLGRKIPSRELGGDTLFIDTSDVLAQLDTADLETLGHSRARHAVLWTYKVTASDVGASLKEVVDRLKAEAPEAVHPCLSLHPRTGTLNLTINPGYTIGIEGMAFETSKALMDRVFSRALQPANVLTYEWRPGDLLVWDNRSVWHKASSVDSDAPRLMHRIGIME